MFPDQLDGFVTNLDSFLLPICEALQLSQSLHNLADKRYEAIGSWLDCPNSSLSQYCPIIHPQGSLAIGTTTRPILHNEFDLDFVVVLLEVNQEIIHDPLKLLGLVENRLQENATYKPMLERMNRCVRLNYADEFHVDILPAVSANQDATGCIKVPDRKLETWKDSNPSGYVRWFYSHSSKVQEQGIRMQIPLPPYQTIEQKSVLQCVVQLLKRWRDVYFLKKPELAPVSIILTTLACKHYFGQNSIENSMTRILSGILKDIDSCPPNQRLVVLNPTNEKEDLSERWENPIIYSAFTHSIKQLSRDWQDLCSKRGLEQIFGDLKSLFGEQPTLRVFEDFAQRASQVERPRVADGLSGKPGLIVPTTVLSAIDIPRHRFYGDYKI
jgi:hypothetical protein